MCAFTSCWRAYTETSEVGSPPVVELAGAAAQKEPRRKIKALATPDLSRRYGEVCSPVVS
jgi:hypothetical protein